MDATATATATRGAAMSYLRTATIKSRFAYRAWDGLWYIVNADGSANPVGLESRSEAVAALRSL